MAHEPERKVEAPLASLLAPGPVRNRGAMLHVLGALGDTAHGRPVGLAVDKTGALLVADDVGGAVWRVTGAGK